jgi:very-short-patch-repair endonuclease
MEEFYLPIKIPKVKCFVCGQELKYITSTHLWMRHGMILAEYKEKFPDAEIMCEKEKERRKKVGGSMGNGNSGGIHSKDHNNNIGKSVRRYIKNNKEQWHEDRSRIATDGNNRRVADGTHPFCDVIITQTAVAQSLRRGMNKSERKISFMLRKLYPKRFKYNGDGRVLLVDKYIPDFVDIDGKRIIEFYGCIHHCCERCNVVRSVYRKEMTASDLRERDERRINRCKELGWTILIVWEHELKDVERIKNRIIEFMS